MRMEKIDVTMNKTLRATHISGSKKTLENKIV